MKICFVLNQFPELSQTFVISQLVGLLELGHQVDVLAATPGSEQVVHPLYLEAEQRFDLQRRTTYTGMPSALPQRVLRGLGLSARALVRHPSSVLRSFDVRRFGWFAASTTVLSMAMPLLGRPRRYDVIVAHFGPQGVVAAALREAKLLCGPLLTIYYGYDLTSAPRRLGSGLYRSSFQLGEKHWAVWQRGVQKLIDLGAPAEKTSVYHLGVDVDAFRAIERPVRDELRVLSIGRLVEKKGFRDAIRAMAAARAAGAKLSYSILGTGPLEGELTAEIERAGLRDVVHLRGASSQAEVHAAIAEHDVLIAPSVRAANGDEEGIPVVLMEALASELPVVSTRHAGIPELVLDGVTGRLAAEGDVAALAAALADLARDPQARQELGRAGRLRVVEQFNLRTQNLALERCCQELASGAVAATKTC